MHIAIDGTPAINDIRAIQRYNYHLLTELAKLNDDTNYTVLYLGCNSKSSDFPELAAQRFRIVKSKIPGRILFPLWKFTGRPRLSNWISERPDVIHFPGGFSYIPNDAKRVITTLHGFLHLLNPGYTNEEHRSFIRRKLDFTVENSDHFITVSQTNKDEVMDIWNISEDRITAIPLGISPEFRIYDISSEMRMSILTKYSIPDKNIILYVGALEPNKNIENIIKAFFYLGRSYQEEWHLVFIGRTTEHCVKYNALIDEFKIKKNVSFVDYLQPGTIELAYFYNLAKLFIFPTLYEGWASPPLEAMKCGTPVIASNISALKESTGGNALYPDPNDPKDISDNLLRLINDDELYLTYKENGLKHVANYTWQRCAQKTSELYKMFKP